ncbi:MAG: 6-phospho-3-hexuloisomerase [Candidatus Limiplasma sp.]|nr:6-phospho-3-hexuloisomerase [Candidatus Limiplasma sp.]
MEDAAMIIGEISRAAQSVEEREVEDAASLILAADTVFVDGFGRSGLQVKGFGMRLEHLGRRACIVGDLTARAITHRDLLVVCSASGASRTLVYHAQRAAAAGAKLLVITSVEDSQLARMAHGRILIKAPTKGKLPGEVASAQPMGTLFEQSAGVVLDALVLRLMRALGEDSASMLKRHANLE